MRKVFLLIIIFMLMCFHINASIVGSCHKIITSTFNKQLPSNIHKLLCKYWVLKKMKNGNQNYYNSSGGAYKELILFSDGRYERKSKSYSTAGKWILKNNTIGFYMTEDNGNPWNKSIDYDYSWKIIEVDSNKLILGIQTPHTYYYYYYVPKLKD